MTSAVKDGNNLKYIRLVESGVFFWHSFFPQIKNTIGDEKFFDYGKNHPSLVWLDLINRPDYCHAEN